MKVVNISACIKFEIDDCSWVCFLRIMYGSGD